MYAAYERLIINKERHYTFVEETHLFGCNVGYIPRLLKHILLPGHNAPLMWHFNVEAALSKDGTKNRALIIFLKPNDARGRLSLYEIAHVWGHSEPGDPGWTPLMLHLRELFADQDPEGLDQNKFSLPSGEMDESVFSMLYVRGSIQDGEICGPWLPPRASPTNSVLLWPNTFEFFMSEARRFLPNGRVPDAVLRLS